MKCQKNGLSQLNEEIDSPRAVARGLFNMPRTFAGHINCFVPFCCLQQNGTREICVNALTFLSSHSFQRKTSA